MGIFNTILIPVDFTINTEVAICKALQIAGSDDPVIHLLHIYKPSFNDVNLGKSQKTEKEIDADLKLAEWKLNIEEYRPHSRVICWTETFLSIEQGIIDKSNELFPDLIVIGKNVNHSILPLLNNVSPSKISKRTGRPVLTVKPGSLDKQSKHIIVPIKEMIAESKMNVIRALCKNNSIKISLVAFANLEHGANGNSTSTLLQVYQELKMSSACSIDHNVLKGQNKVKELLQFAEDVEADILLLEPSREAKVGWLDKHISDIVSPNSRLQVLTV